MKHEIVDSYFVVDALGVPWLIFEYGDVPGLAANRVAIRVSSGTTLIETTRGNLNCLLLER